MVGVKNHNPFQLHRILINFPPILATIENTWKLRILNTQSKERFYRQASAIKRFISYILKTDFSFVFVFQYRRLSDFSFPATVLIVFQNSISISELFKTLFWQFIKCVDLWKRKRNPIDRQNNVKVLILMSI